MAALPPPVPQPQPVREVQLTRAGVFVNRVINDFRLLAIALLLCILAAIVYGAVFLMSAGRGATALLYIPFAFVICRIVQRLARRR